MLLSSCNKDKIYRELKGITTKVGKEEVTNYLLFQVNLKKDLNVTISEDDEQDSPSVQLNLLHLDSVAVH